MLISDWSSDVCSSDLERARVPGHARQSAVAQRRRHEGIRMADDGPEPARRAAGDRAQHLLALHDLAPHPRRPRSEEHTSELQSLMRNSYAVFCLKKKNKKQHNPKHTRIQTR